MTIPAMKIRKPQIVSAAEIKSMSILVVEELESKTASKSISMSPTIVSARPQTAMMTERKLIIAILQIENDE
jgi:hypothetical protein